MDVDSVSVIHEAQEKIQEMVRRIVVGFNPEKIILFGSFARGTVDRDSDVDLLVVKSISGSKREERLAIRQALRGIGLAKDIVLATPEEVARYGHLSGTLLRSALRDGRVLYERAAR
jgi:predicted nucleotidyltransferase